MPLPLQSKAAQIPNMNKVAPPLDGPPSATHTPMPVQSKAAQIPNKAAPRTPKAGPKANKLVPHPPARPPPGWNEAEPGGNHDGL